MLVQYTSVSSLDEFAKARLRQAIPQLKLTHEATLGQVLFDGKYFRLSEVLAMGPGAQLLQE